MLIRRWLTLVLGLSLLAGSPAAAQEAARGRYTVALVGGSTQFDESSALKSDFVGSLYGGLEASYFIRNNLALGGFLLASRPTTDARMFPMNRIEFNSQDYCWNLTADCAIYYFPSQQVVLLETGVHALAQMGLGPVTLQGTGGVGIYRVDLDPQRSFKPVVPGQEVRNMRGMSLLVGGGFAVPMPGGGALRLQVRDFIFTNWDRDKLSIADPLFESNQIPHPNPNPPEKKETIHNIRFEAGFSFSPGTGGGL